MFAIVVIAIAIPFHASSPPGSRRNNNSNSNNNDNSNSSNSNNSNNSNNDSNSNLRDEIRRGLANAGLRGHQIEISDWLY